MDISEKLIYLDNAATSQIPDEVLRDILSQLQYNFGNPNAKYKVGSFANDFLETSRHVVASRIGALSNEIYFTSGATESNNWAFYSVLNQQENVPSVITSAIEHESVLEPLKHLEREGKIKLKIIDVDGKGRLLVHDYLKAFDSSTVLVSIMYANNEIGTIQDIELLSQIAHSHGALFHCDAVQAVGHEYFDLHILNNIDYLSASAHKFHGPKGIGFLYVKEGCPLNPLLYGGGQEMKMRSGTQNVPYIVAMAEALEWSLYKKEHYEELFEAWQNYLIDTLCSEISGCMLTGSSSHRLNHLCSFVIDGVDTEMLLMLLDQDGICVSAGSACSSGSLEISHVLKAIGLDDSVSRGALRISYSYLNTFEEIKYAAQKIIDAVKRCRIFTGDF